MPEMVVPKSSHGRSCSKGSSQNTRSTITISESEFYLFTALPAFLQVVFGGFDVCNGVDGFDGFDGFDGLDSFDGFVGFGGIDGFDGLDASMNSRCLILVLFFMLVVSFEVPL